MITDKEKEEAELLLRSMIDLDLQARVEIISLKLLNIRAESADQARKEAAEIAVAFVDNNMTGLADCDIGLLTDLRAAILGDSAPVSTNSEKLSIAVKALEDIVYLYAGDASIIARNALKEIQG